MLQAALSQNSKDSQVQSHSHSQQLAHKIAYQYHVCTPEVGKREGNHFIYGIKTLLVGRSNICTFFGALILELQKVIISRVGSRVGVNCVLVMRSPVNLVKIGRESEFFRFLFKPVFQNV